MSSLNRSISSVDRRNAALNKWNESDTAKAPSLRRPSQSFTIKFEHGAMLLAAVAAGDLEETNRLIKEGADVNYANVDGLTALHQACIDDNFPMVKLLLDSGADTDACDNEAWTPLHAAASSSSLEIVKYLVTRGADVAAVNSDGDLPLDLTERHTIEEFLDREMGRIGINPDEAREAEERAMTADLEKWQSLGKIDEPPQDIQGATPLHVAASKGYTDVASTLLSLGADPNARDNDGWTPLHAAVYWKNEDICIDLINHGADPTAVNNYGDTPDLLADDEFEPIVKKLFSNSKITARSSPNSPSVKLISSTPSVTKPLKPIVGILKSGTKETPPKPISIPRPSPRPGSLSEDSDKTTPRSTSRESSLPRSPKIIPQPVTPPTIDKTSIESSTITTPSKSPSKIPLISKPPVPDMTSHQPITLEIALEKIKALERELEHIKKERDDLKKLIDQLNATKITSTAKNTPVRSSVAKPPSRP